jgi:hypothetical protein
MIDVTVFVCVCVLYGKLEYLFLDDDNGLICFIHDWTVDQNEIWEYQNCFIEISLNSTRLVNSNYSLID